MILQMHSGDAAQTHTVGRADEWLGQIQTGETRHAEDVKDHRCRPVEGMRRHCVLRECFISPCRLLFVHGRFAHRPHGKERLFTEFSMKLSGNRVVRVLKRL